MMPHYILFPSLESMRKVNLSCAIQPGALTENYRVAWSRVQPNFFPYSDSTFNITVTETTEILSTPSEYQCIASIDHSSMEDAEYSPPSIVVEKRGEDSVVLSFPCIITLSLYSTVHPEWWDWRCISSYWRTGYLCLQRSKTRHILFNQLEGWQWDVHLWCKLGKHSMLHE